MKDVFFLFLILHSLNVFSTEVSFTIDDPGIQDMKTMSHVEVSQKILKTLETQQLKTVLFVCGKRVDSEQGRQILSAWDAQGHHLANHTYSHQNYNSKTSTLSFFQDEIRKNEKLVSSFRNFRKIFRYPMLKEGETVAKRDELRSFLIKEGYAFGHVTIDASDWYISDRMVEKLNQGKKVDLSAYKKYYLGHIWDRAQYYNSLSVKILGREVKHNVLIHHNPLNALFLGDLINMFRSKGWKVIDAEQAFIDPVYTRLPKSLPAGESILWALAKETGRYDSILRYPGEDGEYQKNEMDQLGL